MKLFLRCTQTGWSYFLTLLLIDIRHVLTKTYLGGHVADRVMDFGGLKFHVAPVGINVQICLCEFV